ncbi:hypothetical protein ACHAW5_009503 [Stephanodiscus triporus]|uniref:Uncharacterized protein n=1 Tax=Stephanodiscus triporus TaxID=2934178 RepID=A0ABD3Q0R5_9STRA
MATRGALERESGGEESATRPYYYPARLVPVHTPPVISTAGLLVLLAFPSDDDDDDDDDDGGDREDGEEGKASEDTNSQQRIFPRPPVPPPLGGAVHYLSGGKANDARSGGMRQDRRVVVIANLDASDGIRAIASYIISSSSHGTPGLPMG